jgi:hypothetical protein
MTTVDLVAQRDTASVSEREDELVLHLIWSSELAAVEGH